jgi:hypothetical protein
MNPISNSKKLSIEAVDTITSYIKENNPWKLLAFINNHEMTAPSAPFVWSLNPDDKQPDTFRCTINSHSFFLVDINVYYDDGTDVKYKAKYRNEFKKYVKKVFDTCLGKGHGFNPSDVFDVEVDIFNVLGCQDITRKEEKY